MGPAWHILTAVLGSPFRKSLISGHTCPTMFFSCQFPLIYYFRRAFIQIFNLQSQIVTRIRPVLVNHVALQGPVRFFE